MKYHFLISLIYVSHDALELQGKIEKNDSLTFSIAEVVPWFLVYKIFTKDLLYQDTLFSAISRTISACISLA
jgi:hypothetical protein